MALPRVGRGAGAAGCLCGGRGTPGCVPAGVAGAYGTHASKRRADVSAAGGGARAPLVRLDEACAAPRSGAPPAAPGSPCPAAGGLQGSRSMRWRDRPTIVPRERGPARSLAASRDHK